MRFYCPKPFESSILNQIIRQFYLYGMTAPEYIIGVFFYKYKIFSKSDELICKLGKWKYVTGIMIFGVLLLGRTLIVRSLFVAPVSGSILIILHHWFCKESRFLCWIGTHSTSIWLIHMFFYSVLSVNFIFIFRCPILIFIFITMMVITVLISALLKKI